MLSLQTRPRPGQPQATEHPPAALGEAPPGRGVVASDPWRVEDQTPGRQPERHLRCPEVAMKTRTHAHGWHTAAQPQAPVRGSG